MTQVFYCIPTYKSFEECRLSIHAVMRGSIQPTQVIVIDNSGNGSAALYLSETLRLFDNVFVWPQNRNIGVSAAWNMFHHNISKDYIVIANDDIQVHTYTLEALVTRAQVDETLPIIHGNNDSGNAYSLFLLRHWAFKKIGDFDEKFSPAYFEDNDYARRLLLAGYDGYFEKAVTYDHVGSSTLKKYTQQEMEAHHRAFERNARYYRAKWGGMPGEERYTEPFDGIL